MFKALTSIIVAAALVSIPVSAEKDVEVTSWCNVTVGYEPPVRNGPVDVEGAYLGALGIDEGVGSCYAVYPRTAPANHRYDARAADGCHATGVVQTVDEEHVRQWFSCETGVTDANNTIVLVDISLA